MHIIMKLSIALLLASSTGWATALERQCHGNARNEGGNWFCGEIEHMLYTGMRSRGSYKTVTGMGSNGQCSMQDKSYDGPLGPLDDELSIHIRGPFHLKEAAVYNLGAGNNWNRVAYYNAERRQADNMVFMGNYGGQGSGVFDYKWGNSLSYLNADGTAGTGSPQVLKDVQVPSGKEFSIFSGQRCDGSCGFSRANDVAYKGFGGGNKVFLFHFKMPLDGNRGFNGDMPALWALNARIPRAAQYNACNCWQTGCGEFDIFEVLAKGDRKCKSTFHMASGFGSSDYFARPVDGFVKIAVVLSAKTSAVSIHRLDYNTGFESSFSDATVFGWLMGPMNGKGASKFEAS
ncbi:Protein TOS1 [Purpureocillium lavendulum]|uniref:glucan endo-1,3-beta-D-glucosidase n=1 Tax=Purpureocillium lavendulum TaxID=1247861 RepID=A0AB34FU93_9HYPO|nr:Protein TOS1 [Purpureocillium lavendulum]